MPQLERPVKKCPQRGRVTVGNPEAPKKAVPLKGTRRDTGSVVPTGSNHAAPYLAQMNLVSPSLGICVQTGEAPRFTWPHDSEHECSRCLKHMKRTPAHSRCTVNSTEVVVKSSKATTWHSPVPAPLSLSHTHIQGYHFPPLWRECYWMAML